MTDTIQEKLMKDYMKGEIDLSTCSSLCENIIEKKTNTLTLGRGYNRFEIDTSNDADYTKYIQVDNIMNENIKLKEEINQLKKCNENHLIKLKSVVEIHVDVTNKLQEEIDQLKKLNKVNTDQKDSCIDPLDTSLWLREKFELGIVLCKFIKDLPNNIADLIDPTIFGSYLTILFMNAFGVPANISKSDLDIALTGKSHDQEDELKLMQYMNSLFKLFHKKTHNNSNIAFGKYNLVTVSSFNIDVSKEVKYNYEVDYQDIPMLKLYFKHQETSELFSVDLVAWVEGFNQDVRAKEIMMTPDGVKLSSNVSFHETLFRISKGETYISKNLYDLQHSILRDESDVDYRKFAVLVTQRLPKALFLGLRLVGNHVPYLEYINNRFMTKVICDNVYNKQDTVIKCGCHECDEVFSCSMTNAIRNLKTSATCNYCGKWIIFRLETVKRTDIPYIQSKKSIPLPKPTKLAIVHIKENQFVKEEDVAKLEKLIYS
jgi:hypothetical protein